MDRLTIQDLLQQRADAMARLNLMPYDGSPEVKEQNGNRYLYVRKRVAGRLTSTYVDVYSDSLYQLLLRNAREARELRKQIRHLDKSLAQLGYQEGELTPEVQLNLDFARVNMKSSIYDQAVLEGVATTFPQTEEIINNGIVNGVKASDVQKILNLKRAWEFILDKDVLQSPSDYHLLCHVAKLINEGFYADGGRIRSVPVTIGGTSYVPSIPLEPDIIEALNNIIESPRDPIDTAVELCLYCMKTQIFNDGNKRAAVIYANHWLISHAGGLLVIPETEVPEFKQLLVEYYEGKHKPEIKAFLKNKCWKKNSF
ncbi:MAG: Fic family protein [Firmicutes bacterium]|nr:Fic family protein [Bacillota bacterium]